MKVLMGIFLITFSTSLHAEDKRDSVDELFYKRQMKHVYNMEDETQFSSPKDRDFLIKKLEIKGSWRWSIEEWEQIMDNVFPPMQPEYYYDGELKASNDGWSLA
ncbi:MAG: hypothetical protein WCH46_01105 [bacterium]